MDINLDYKTYRYLIYGWIILAVIVFVVLLKIPAPYGRHTKTSWGPLISNHVGWIVMELTVLIVLWIFLLPAIDSMSIVTCILVTLFCVHYVNRAVIFPFRLRTKGKKMPVLIMLSAVVFNTGNGFFLGYYLANAEGYAVQWLASFQFVAGLILFFTGMYINWKADNILIHLRKPGETAYVIPQQWLFRSISCPNLFGELVEWAGYALLSWNLPATSFLIWTAANLIPRALAHHQWYKRNFPDYPKDRKALFPNLL